MRFRLLAIASVAALGMVSACGGGGSTSGLPGGAGGGSKKASSIVADAPVAPDSAIPPGSVMAKIRKQGTLRVGGSLDAPLLSQKNPVTGEVEGFDALMGKMLAKYITGKPSVKIVSSTTQTREALLKNHTVDVVIQTYSVTPERAKQVNFAGPYFVSGQSIMVRSGTTSIDSPSDLNGKTVIVGANTPSIPAVKKVAPKAEILSFQTDPQCVKALEQGRGAAYVQSRPILAATAKEKPDLKIVGEPFVDDPFGIGVPKDQPELARFINDWVRTMIEKGLWQRAWKQTFGTVTQGGPPEPPKVGSLPATRYEDGQ